MRKSTKGALAGIAAAALLLGGFGTHASWTDSKTIAGGDSIKDGSLSLGSVTCGDWSLYLNASDPTGTVESALTNVFLLPGQLLKRHCTVAVNLKGVGSVTATVDAPGLTLPSAVSGAGTGLTVSTAVTNGTTPVTTDGNGVTTTSVTDGDSIAADFTVKLDSAASTAWQAVTGTLNNLNVTVTTA